MKPLLLLLASLSAQETTSVSTSISDADAGADAIASGLAGTARLGADSIASFIAENFESGLAPFLVTSVIAVAAALLLRRLIVRGLRRRENDGHRNLKFIASLVTAVIYFLAAVAILSQITPFHSIAGSLFASSGLFAVIIGLAAQDAIANLVGGIFVTVFKPFSEGDLITVNGTTGTVTEITLRHTVIRTFSASHVIIPNSIINSSTLENLTATGEGYCNFLTINVSDASDTERAKQIIAEEAAAHPAFVDKRDAADIAAGKPAVQVICTELGSYYVSLRASLWTADVGSGFLMLSDLRQSLKKRFEAEGIEIPYPCSNVRLSQGGAPEKNDL